MKKKQLKKQLKDCQQSLLKTNESWDRLNQENKDQDETIEEMTEVLAQRMKIVIELSNKVDALEKIIKKKTQTVNDLNRQLKENWEGKENIELRKSAAYWKEAFEIAKQSNKALTERNNDLCIQLKSFKN